MAGLMGPRFGAQPGQAKQLVVVLHGLGADGQDLIQIAPDWAEALPEAAFIAPDAPHPCDMAPYGRQWFSVQDRTPAVMAAGVRSAAAALGPLVEAELAGFGLPPAALALAGFSQGAMMALQLGLRGASAPATILAYSGALLGPESLAAELTGKPPVLLVHGEADDVVPVAATRAAEAALRAAGIPVEAIYRPGLPHAIDPAGIEAGMRALARAFGMTAG